jgi:hypothetical protein
MSAPPGPEEQFARWLAAHPAATLLEIAAFFAARALLGPAPDAVPAR